MPRSSVVRPSSLSVVPALALATGLTLALGLTSCSGDKKETTTATTTAPGDTLAPTRYTTTSHPTTIPVTTPTTGLATTGGTGGTTGGSGGATTGGATTGGATSGGATTGGAPQTFDWDHVKWDYGEIVGATQVGATVVISFDRHQLYMEGGPKEAKEFTEEPVVYGNSDYPNINENPKIRRYAVSPGAELLYLTNQQRTSPWCNDNGVEEPPNWATFTFADLLAMNSYVTGTQTALTFDGNGQVIRIRRSAGC